MVLLDQIAQEVDDGVRLVLCHAEDAFRELPPRPSSSEVVREGEEGTDASVDEDALPSRDRVFPNPSALRTRGAE